MIKQVLLPILGVALFIIIVGALTQKSTPFNLSKYLALSTPAATKTMTVGNKTIQVEIANTSDSRQKGLSGRKSLPQDSGMLFVFESKNVYPSFWMKDMLIPLDMIWISGGKIIKIDSSIPAPTPGTPDNKLPIYSPGKPIDYVLEVNSGFAATNKLKVGDSITLPTL